MHVKRGPRELILNFARIWSILSLGFLLIILGGHVVEELKGGPDNLSNFKNARELFVFLCFPVSTLVGLAAAWKSDGLGGAITVIGMIGLYVLRPDLLTQWTLLVLPAPGVLFLIHWIIRINQTEETEVQTG